MKTIGIATILLLTAGCASAPHTSFRDPAYANRDFTKVAVFAVGMDQDHAFSIERLVCSKLAPAQCVSGMSLLSPSRTYSPNEIRQSLTQANIDGVLVMVLGDDQTTSAYLPTILPSTQSGTRSLYTNIATWLTPPQQDAIRQSNAVPLYTYERSAHAVVGLIDRSSGKTAWGGPLKVRGEGAASLSDVEFVREATDELAAELRQNRLVKIPATLPKG